MNVRIGIADTGREVEVEVEDRADIVGRLEEAFSKGGAILWFNDVKGNEVGIPTGRIAYVELVTAAFSLVASTDALSASSRSTTFVGSATSGATISSPSIFFCASS